MKNLYSKSAIFFILSLNLLLLPAASFAAPGITGVSGTVGNGQSITISGSGFGTKSPAKPFLWAPFEGSINPSNLGVKTSWDQNENMAYTAGEGVSGTGGAKATNNSGTWTLGVNSSGFHWNDYSQQVYIFRKKKLNFDTPDSLNWKVWRIWSPNYTYPNIYVQSGNGCVYTEGIMPSCSWFSGGAFRGTTNSFNTEEIIFKSNTSSGSSDGILKLYENGSQAANLNNIQTKNGTTGMTMNFPVHFVQANASMSTNDRVWMDDVYLDTTWARVMLGNASTLSASTHIEPQIPSTWTTTGITVTVNTGTFATNSTAYLFVVDANGNSSPGYLVNLGKTTTPLPAPPQLNNIIIN